MLPEVVTTQGSGWRSWRPRKKQPLSLSGTMRFAAPDADAGGLGRRRGVGVGAVATFSHGCALSPSLSAPLLSWRPSSRGGANVRAPGRPASPGPELPALGGGAQPPLSFEDMYASARRRTAKRSATMRQGGPASPSASQQLASLRGSRPAAAQGSPWGAAHGGARAEGEAAQVALAGPVLQSLFGSEAPEAPEAAANAAPEEGLDVDWMVSVLSPDAAAPREAAAPALEVAAAAVERQAPTKKVRIQAAVPPPRPQGAAAAGPDAGGGPPEEPRKASRSRTSARGLGEAQQPPAKAAARQTQDGGQENGASFPDAASQSLIGSVESADLSVGSAGNDELSETDLDDHEERWRTAFNRFKAPGDCEVHVDHVGELLGFLGHGLTMLEHYGPLLSEVTQYHYFDFHEFCTFMMTYQKWERHKMREIFREYDTDGSGEISITELRPLMASLGLVPFTATIREALMEVDDGNAQLSFEELTRFLTVYSKKQGFSSAETKELRLHFDRFAGRDPDGDAAALDPSAATPAGSAAAAAGGGLEQRAGTPPGSPGAEGARPGSSGRLLRRATNKPSEPKIMENVLALPYVETVLTLSCGHQQAQFARAVVERFLRAQGYQGAGSAAEGLTFEEFLVVARMIRECQRERLKQDNPDMVERLTDAGEVAKRRSTVAQPKVSRATMIVEAARSEKISTTSLFEMADEDGNGSVSISELKSLLKDQGYTALKAVISEICMELVQGWDTDYELDFNELFDFLMVFHQREGFLKAEVEAFRRVFQDHDEDNSGEVGTSELSKLLRYLGYRHSTSDVHSYIIAADINQSGQLDWREFLHLMRCFKEGACEEAQRVFEQKARWVRAGATKELEQVMDQKHLGRALEQLGYSAEAAAGARPATSTKLRLDDFIGILDATRVDFVERERVKAGFTEDELGFFRRVFDTHDRNKTGFIGVLEMETILNMFAWGPTDKQEQLLLASKMQMATERARATGMPGAIGSDGETSFWVFVQLLRLLHDEQDRSEDAQLRALCCELRFSEVEVDQFHQVFRHYAKPNPEFITGLQRGVAPYLLPGDGARKLIRFLGVHIGESEGMLQEKLASLDPKGPKGHPRLEFWPFLRLMRWLMDTNFNDVNDCVASRLRGLPAEADSP